MDEISRDSITFDGATPRNTRFGDTYFTKADGQAETSFVFIGCNNLLDRWNALNAEETFTIAELGFGTGLNFLETVRQWQEANAKGTLRYISFEAFPMPKADLVKSLEPWPQLSAGSEWLATFWPPDKGTHFLSHEGVELELHIGDARVRIDDVQGPVDAWYLDGFAPARNPELWESELLERVFGLTAVSGTFATYTCAGWVRRNLQAAGFEIEKIPGFAGKREMLRGYRPQTENAG
jgi:tRNA U34 5-methylaminomethyl-2-thiouridine-forming methyltransferase MnmC